MSKAKMKENKKNKSLTKEELLADLQKKHDLLVALREKREKKNGK